MYPVEQRGSPAEGSASVWGMRMRRPLWRVLVVVLLAGLLLPVSLVGTAGRHVSLVIDGEVVASRVPARLVDSRTMVPVRIISERLGALVDWLPVTRQVVILRGGTEILLTIGSAEVLVDGQQSSLPVAPFIDDGTTLVPLRFVSEVLGADVAWDGDTHTVTITDASPRQPPPTDDDGAARLVSLAHVVVDGSSGIRIRTAGQPRLTFTDIETETGDYPRILVELENTVSDLAGELPGQGGMLRDVLVDDHTDSLPATRIWLELVEPTAHRVLGPTWDADQGYLDTVLVFQDRVHAVAFHEADDGSCWVDVATGVEAPFRAFQLESPHRLVVDIEGIAPGRAVAGLTLPVASPTVERIRAALFQASPTITRVVLDSERRLAYDIVRTDAGLRIMLSGSMISLEVERDQAGLVMSIATTMAVDAVCSYDAELGALVLDLPRINYGNGVEPAYRPDELLQTVTASAVSLTTAGGQVVGGTRVTMELSRYWRHALIKSAEGLELRVSGPPLEGRTIVVDPGHGGNDPGAVGPGGTLEKDIALDVSRRLASVLEDQGATVVLTREGDYNPCLHDRAAAARQYGADLIMSVHFNGVWNREIKGTETYYTHNHPASARLASTVHAVLLEDLGRLDRGVRRREFVLVREPRVPAVLVEPLYLTNAQEEQLLMDPGFRQQVADSLARGVVEFFWAP